MGVRHTFIRGAKALQTPLEAADQRSGARGAGRRIHRCWPASRGCQPAACGRYRLWNVAIDSVVSPRRGLQAIRGDRPRGQRGAEEMQRMHERNVAQQPRDHPPAHTAATGTHSTIPVYIVSSTGICIVRVIGSHIRTAGAHKSGLGRSQAHLILTGDARSPAGASPQTSGIPAQAHP